MRDQTMQSTTIQSTAQSSALRHDKGDKGNGQTDTQPNGSLPELTLGRASDYELVAQAIRYLEQNFRAQPSLDDLAAALHVSPFHLQRVFTRWAGISPKRFLQYVTADYAKSQLGKSQNVLDAAYAAGLSGPGRLHDLLLAVEAVTPGEYKQAGAGLTIHYGRHATPFGECLLAVTPRGVCALNFLDVDHSWEAAEAALAAAWPEAKLINDSSVTAATAARIFALHQEQPSQDAANAAPLRLLVKGTNFQLKVWEALLRIPAGTVCTYSDVARAIGNPKATRAVGSALGANAIAYLIPCHRVIRQSGALSDYRWGATRKRALIGWEAAQKMLDKESRDA